MQVENSTPLEDFVHAPAVQRWPSAALTASSGEREISAGNDANASSGNVTEVGPNLTLWSRSQNSH
jgi:hypothetical protein